MPQVQARAAIRTIAIVAASSLAAGLMTTLAPAAPATAARVSADHPPTAPSHQVRLRNGDFTHLTRTPAPADAHTYPVLHSLFKLLRNGRLLARPASAALGSSTGSISGRVTGGGRPLAGVCVLAANANANFYRIVRTAKTGKYRATGLRPGTYGVVFLADLPGCPNQGNWLAQWYRQLDTPGIPLGAVFFKVRAGRDTAGINARLHHGGQITGTVRNRAGQPVGGICVLAPGDTFGGVTKTTADGHFAMRGLYPDGYRVEFRIGCGTTRNYALQWWRGSASASRGRPIKVGIRQLVTGIDPVLVPGGLLTGRVVAKMAPHRPLARICLYAVAFGTTSFQADDADATAVTAKDGSFELKGLATSRYHLRVDPTCDRRRSSLYESDATTFRIRAGQVDRGFTIRLSVSAGVSGVVKDAKGRPIKGICVRVDGLKFISTKTNGDGRYQIIDVSPGTHRIQFSGGCGNSVSVIAQYYQDKPDFDTANQIKLPAGKITPDIDAVVKPGGSITGTVTGKSGHPLSGICVGLTTPENSDFVGAGFDRIGFTNRAGQYRLSNLTPGPYQLTANCDGVRGYAQSWFRSATDSTTASFLSVTPGSAETVNFKLTRAGAISGLVTGAGKRPLSGICVFVANPKTKLLLNLATNPALAHDGRYRIAGLGPGQYIVQFMDCQSGRAPLGPQWYSHRTTASFATPVTVRAGQTTTGISAVMRTGATISGIVTGPSGQPLGGVCVQAGDPAALDFGIATTSSQGHYTMSGLGTGRYTVRFSPCGAGARDLGSVQTQAQATVPRITTVKIQLKAGGSISGTASGPTTPPESTCVLAVPRDPSASPQTASTDAKGQYRMRDLVAGSYQVYFGDEFCPPFADNSVPPRVAPQWYNGQADQSSATSVTVSAGHDTGGIDAKLMPFGSITGSVSNLGLAGLGDECVTAVPFAAKPDPLFGQSPGPETAISTPSGHYALLGLLPGQYKVGFSRGCGRTGYANQWWHNVSSQQAAKVINVAFTEVGGIDARLRRR